MSEEFYQHVLLILNFIIQSQRQKKKENFVWKII